MNIRIARLFRAASAALAIALLGASLALPQPARAAGTSVDEMPDQMSRAYVLSIQQELLAHGYYVGGIDGRVGKRTKGAIRQYQRDAGLPVDALATKELLDHLKFSIPKVYARGTAVETHPQVAEVQAELKARGYYQGMVDGRDGPLTRAAVAKFQQDAGLSIDGDVGGGVLHDLRVADPGIRHY